MSQQEPCCPNPNLKPQGDGYFWCTSCGSIIEPAQKPTSRIYLDLQPDLTYTVTLVRKLATSLPIDQAIDLAGRWQR